MVLAQARITVALRLPKIPLGGGSARLEADAGRPLRRMLSHLRLLRAIPAQRGLVLRASWLRSRRHFLARERGCVGLSSLHFELHPLTLVRLLAVLDERGQEKWRTELLQAAIGTPA